MSCPYCGLDPITLDHIEQRHGITPNRHALLQTRRVPDFGVLGAPAGTALTVTTGTLSRVIVSPDRELGGYL